MKNSRKAVEAEYNWESLQNKFLNAYMNLTAKPGGNQNER
jgi:hypothetical protein